MGDPNQLTDAELAQIEVDLQTVGRLHRSTRRLVVSNRSMQERIALLEQELAERDQQLVQRDVAIQQLTDELNAARNGS